MKREFKFIFLILLYLSYALYCFNSKHLKKIKNKTPEKSNNNEVDNENKNDDKNEKPGYRVTRVINTKDREKLKKNSKDSDKQYKKEYVMYSSFDSDPNSDDEDKNADIKNNEDFLELLDPRKDNQIIERHPYFINDINSKKKYKYLK